MVKQKKPQKQVIVPDKIQPQAGDAEVAEPVASQDFDAAFPPAVAKGRKRSHAEQETFEALARTPLRLW